MDARKGANEYQREHSANGVYSLGYAFGNNESIIRFIRDASADGCHAHRSLAPHRVCHAT